MKSLAYKQVTAVASLPTPSAALEGVLVRLVSDDKPYWCDGSTWTDLTIGGASPLGIYDEGALLTATPTSINFTGPGVTATHTGDAVTVTVAGGGGSGLTYTPIKTANYTASANEIVRVNSNGGSFAVSLPITPPDGSVVGIFDVFGDCANYPVLATPLSGTVEGDASGLSINVNGAYVQLVYNAAMTNWKVADTYGSEYALVGKPANLSRVINLVAHGRSVMDFVHVSDSAVTTGPHANGMVSEVIDANNFVVVMSGFVTGLSGLNSGFMYMVDPATQTLTTGFYEAAYHPGYSTGAYFLATGATSGIFYPADQRLDALGGFFTDVPSATAGVTSQLWRTVGTLSSPTLAIATSEFTLADSASFLTYGTHTLLCKLDHWWDFEVPALSAADPLIPPTNYLAQEGDKIYLSATVPGGVTHIPPAIRQVVGYLNGDGDVLFCQPYREYASSDQLSPFLLMGA